MSIVPTNTPLEVEAYFENRDAGFLALGQKAVIKLDSFPAERFGALNGTITFVSKDARKIPPESKWVYATRIDMQANSIKFGKKLITYRLV